MQIPLNTPKQPPLELLSMKLYSTGLNKVFTNRFYKSLNHNFGVEITIRNNTMKLHEMKIGGCVYDGKKTKVASWMKMKKINSRSTMLYDFYVTERKFSELSTGNYIVIFWVNDKKIKEIPFVITYK